MGALTREERLGEKLTRGNGEGNEWDIAPRSEKKSDGTGKSITGLLQEKKEGIGSPGGGNEKHSHKNFFRKQAGIGRMLRSKRLREKGWHLREGRETYKRERKRN